MIKGASVHRIACSEGQRGGQQIREVFSAAEQGGVKGPRNPTTGAAAKDPKGPRGPKGAHRHESSATWTGLLHCL